MKRLCVCSATLLCVALILCSCAPNEKTREKPLIGIAKIVQHEALDAIERGIQDELAAQSIDVTYDLQNANNDVNTAAQIAHKFKADKVDVAVGIATPVAISLANTIKDKPVIFSSITDPVAAGLVSSIEHGEGNITGLSDMIPINEHIRLFKELAGIRTLGYIYTSSEANSVSSLALVEAACAQAGLKLITQSITNSSEVKQAAESIIKRVDGIYLTTDNTVFSALPALIHVFSTAKKPIFSADVTGAMNGGCTIASGFNYYKAGRATGQIIAQVLAGTAPADIPIRFITNPTESDLLFDLDEAANCGIVIPEAYISMANMIYQNETLTTK